MAYRPVSSFPLAIGQTPAGLERVVLMLGGVIVREWVYDPQDAESKDAALKAFDECAIATQREIEKNLGRRLTTRELFHGLEHVEDENPFSRAQVKAERDAMFAPPPDPRNWAERKLDEHKAAKKRERDPQGAFLEEQVERLAAKKAEEERRAALAANPRRQKCVEHATAALAAAKYDHTLPASEVRAAEFRLRLAKEGNLRLYQHEYNQFQKRHDERLRQLAQPHIDGVRAHEEARRRLVTPFELPAASIEEAASDPYATAEERAMAAALQQHRQQQQENHQ